MFDAVKLHAKMDEMWNMDSWVSCCLGIYLLIVQELIEDASYQDQSITTYSLKLADCGNQLYLTEASGGNWSFHSKNGY